YGIRKVTVDEICREAEVSKMTFYRFFDNKIEVAALMLTGIYETALADFRKIMQSNLSFPEKTARIIWLKHEGTLGISEEFLNDVYHSGEPALKELVTRYAELSLRLLQETFIKAQKQGWIREELKIEFLMYMIDRIKAYMFDEKLKAMFPNSHDRVMELTRFFFYGTGTPDKTLHQ
ncbi:MAG: TetR/AcrR family transcriptional regulator, partial [Lentimicrobiaceae bacterium]|nr:TetR/AcrR family transcriptional regulator [Lentimicrobiaceae bacterium]